MEKATHRNSIIKLILIGLGMGLFLFYFYTNNPSEEGSKFLRCPSNALFHIYCPGCGSQRALHYLLHLEWKEALRHNALFVGAVPIFLIGFVNWVRNEIFQQNVSINFLQNKKVLIALFILILLFGILRNIDRYPFTLLIP